MADVDAYLDVWLFIVSASSIFDDSNFVVTHVLLRNYRFCRDTFLSYNKEHPIKTQLQTRFYVLLQVRVWGVI